MQDFDKPFIIYTDASEYALGTGLAQKNPERMMRIIRGRCVKNPERRGTQKRHHGEIVSCGGMGNQAIQSLRSGQQLNSYH